MSVNLSALAQESKAAYSIIQPYIWHTPFIYSPALSKRTEGEVWLKLENVQLTGSFKIRGAAYKLSKLKQAGYSQRVITASTGNHGHAVAHMAQVLGMKASLFLPTNTPQSKLDKLTTYPAELVKIGTDGLEAEEAAKEKAEKEGLVYLSPYNDLDVMAGQGTIACELTEKIQQLDAVVVSVGGGGLISGIGAYMKTYFPDTQIIGCQPANSDIMYRSIQAGKVLDLPSSPTLSHGTAGGIEEEAITFSYCQEIVDEWMIIQEEDIQESLRWLLQHQQLLVEGAAGLTVAPCLAGNHLIKGKRLALILCGSKISYQELKSLFE
ncbi:MAG: threonine/serine dehydratase [Bacteroidota bacterium]